MGAVMNDEPAVAPTRVAYIESLKEDIHEEFDNGRTAETIQDWITKENLESNERMYLWSILKSEVRTALNAVTRPKPPAPNVTRMSPGPGLKKIGVRTPAENESA